MENWDRVEAVQRVQDYIEGHVSEPISLHDLARVAGYSPWHTSRIFAQLMGKTPLEYIRSVRLSRAAMRLQDESARVIEVALEFAFDSHEGFTRAFSEQFGLSPKSYRDRRPPIRLFLPEAARDYYLKVEKGERTMSDKPTTNTVFVQVVERPARKLILKRGVKAEHYFEYCEEVGCDIWDTLCGIKEALYEPIGIWLPENLRTPGTSVYAQGVEVPADYCGEIPTGFEIIDLPACKMMVFQGPPFDDEKFGEAIDDLWSIMNSYNSELYGFKWADEDGPRFQLEPQGERGYIEARPVRAMTRR